MRQYVPCWILLLVLALIGGASSAQATCTAGQVVGTTTYITTTYTPTGAGAWSEGLISWWRSVTWNCTKTTKVVSECYNSSWDRFWAVNGTCKTVTVTVTPLPPRTTHETKYFCGSTAPPTTLPPSESDITLGALSPKNPGSTGEVFAEVARLISAPGEGVLDPKNATFSDVVAVYGQHFSDSAVPFENYYKIATSLQDPTKPIHPELDQAFANFTTFTRQVAADLATGAPKDPAPYLTLSRNLSALVTNPAMASTQNYVKAYPHLASAAVALQKLSSLVRGGLNDDTARYSFLLNLETVRQGYLNFGLEFGHQLVLPEPATPEPSEETPKGNL